MGCASSVNIKKSLPPDPENATVARGLTHGAAAPPSTNAALGATSALADVKAGQCDGSPLLPLAGRAVHLRFLRAMAELVIRVDGKKVRFGEVPIFQAVNSFVRPGTATGKKSFMEAVVARELNLKFLHFSDTADSSATTRVLSDADGTAGAPSSAAASGSSSGAEGGKSHGGGGGRSVSLPQVRELTECGRERLGGGADATGPVACGPTTFFVSYAWSYSLDRLVGMLEGHYRLLPGAMVLEGQTPASAVEYYLPVYYWVDIFAVTQHFKGDFKDHPDSDFPGVIRSAQAVLFTLFPLERPITFTRVWCLFEAMTALQSDIQMEMLLDSRHGFFPDAAEGEEESNGGGEVERQQQGDGDDDGDQGSGWKAYQELKSAFAPGGLITLSFCPPLQLRLASMARETMIADSGPGAEALSKDLEAVFEASMAAWRKKDDAATTTMQGFQPDNGPNKDEVDELMAAVVALAEPDVQAAAREWRRAQGLDGGGAGSGSRSASSGGGSSGHSEEGNGDDGGEEDEEEEEEGEEEEEEEATTDDEEEDEAEDGEGSGGEEGTGSGDAGDEKPDTRGLSSSSERVNITQRRRAEWPVSQRSVHAAVSSLDVTQAQATVRSDYDYILGLIREGLGVERFNKVLQEQLQLRFMERLLVQAWNAGDHLSAAHLLLRGARCLSPVLKILLPCGDDARRCAPSLLVALRASSGLRDLRLHGESAGSWRTYQDGDVVAFALAAALVDQQQVGTLAPAAVQPEAAAGSDPGLGCYSSLRQLSLMLPVGPEGCRALGEALRANSNVSTLELSGMYLTEACLVPLFAALAEGNRSIVHLKLFGANIGPGGAEGLCRFVRANPSLTKLELANGALTDAEFAQLVDAVLAVGRLQHLNLFQNMLTPACAPSLERLLAESTTLRVLNVSGGGGKSVGAEGYAAVARGLAVNSILRELHCMDLGPSGARALLAVVTDPAAACRRSLRVLTCGWRRSGKQRSMEDNLLEIALHQPDGEQLSVLQSEEAAIAALGAQIKAATDEYDAENASQTMQGHRHEKGGRDKSQ